VHVPAALFRDFQDLRRQQQAVGDHHHHVGLQRMQRIARQLRLQRFRLQYRETVLQRLALDRRRLQSAAAASGPVGLGVDGDDFTLACRRAQRRHGEFGGAGEDDPHRRRQAACLRCLASFLRTISRLSGER